MGGLVSLGDSRPLTTEADRASSSRDQPRSRAVYAGHLMGALSTVIDVWLYRRERYHARSIGQLSGDFASYPCQGTQ